MSLWNVGACSCIVLSQEMKGHYDSSRHDNKLGNGYVLRRGFIMTTTIAVYQGMYAEVL